MKIFGLILLVIAFMLSACLKHHSGANKNSDQAISAQKSNEQYASLQLTKELFLLKVWDYTTTPNEWKYLGNKPAIVDFYADWCGPCKIASPILDEIGAEYAGKILIYKVNTDQETELAKVFGITGIPAFLYIPATGKPVMTSGIGQSKVETKKMFVENMEKYLSVKK